MPRRLPGSDPRLCPLVQGSCLTLSALLLGIRLWNPREPRPAVSTTPPGTITSAPAFKRPIVRPVCICHRGDERGAQQHISPEDHYGQGTGGVQQPAQGDGAILLRFRHNLWCER